MLAGDDARAARAVSSARGFDLPVHVFDTSPGESHRCLRELGAVVERVRWNDSFADARNAGLDLVEACASRHDWILWIDADEYLEDLRFVPPPAHVSGMAYCPVIKDPEFLIHTVGRIHSLHEGLRFRGSVHEYLVGVSGHAVDYFPTATTLWHDGYAEVDRSIRNMRLLRRQMRIEPEEARWIAFLLRDGNQRLSIQEIVTLHRKLARTSDRAKREGGMSHSDYIRMAAWATSTSLCRQGRPEAVRDSLEPYEPADRELSWELVYLRLIGALHAGTPDTALFAELIRARTSGELDDDVHVLGRLDAVIAAYLDVLGAGADAVAYRRQSTRYSDAFFLDSRLRSAIV